MIISSSEDMIDFVGKPPFLRIALRVAMVTIHFHTAQPGLFLGTFLSYSGYAREQFSTNGTEYLSKYVFIWA